MPDSTPKSSPHLPPTGSAPRSGAGRRRKRGLWARVKRNANEIWTDNKILIVGTLFFLAFFTAFFWNQIFVLIRSGQAGVIYRPFSGGSYVERTWDEGMHIVAPWNHMFIYNTRVQQVPDTFTVLSVDGLAVEVEVSIRFRPTRENLGLLHKNVGPDYIETIVKPEVQSQFRFILGQYTPDQIYTTQGFIVQTVKQGVLARLNARWVLLDDLLLKAVKLPKTVAESIETKLRAQQLAFEYEYRIEAEYLEKERKSIEAEGIAIYNRTVTGSGLDPSFLQFRGIQATLELAKSPNAKVIVIGGGENGLPLILDGRTEINPVPGAAMVEPATPDPAGPLSTSPRVNR